MTIRIRTRDKTKTNGLGDRLAIILGFLLLLTALSGRISVSLVEVSFSSLESLQNSSFKTSPTQCTRADLLKIRSHLDPSTCLGPPYLQKCSITQATKCPDPGNWLEEYYTELQQEYITATVAGNDDDEPFVGLSVGCNKGFDALNTLRMGTFNSKLSKTAWGRSMNPDGKLHGSVCGQNVVPPFEVHDDVKKIRKGEVHCFEPMPSTYKQLNHSAKDLGYDQYGFKVVHGAVSKEEGKALFFSDATPGVENQGLSNCQRSPEACEEVDVLSLNTYSRKNLGGDGPIHILQIDVEGYDGDVLLGAGKEVLERVEYLEFEYNWMGSWKEQHLYDIVQMLDETNFTCYWAGVQRLWRITNCWMLFYDIHTWSNVACVNRERVPRLATKMEAVFQETLKEEKSLPYFDESKHEALSTDQKKMTSFFLSKTSN